MARLEFQGVGKTYPGGIVAADDVDLAIESGELFVIVGPSGSGKSTLLRLVAGLETLDAGSIHLDGRRIDGFPPRDRGVAMVFQGQVLYPHLDVFENIAFGLRARKWRGAEVETLVRAVAATLGLADVLARPIATLSGGQRQRVALGRALVLRPRLFLCDEPFSGLDAPLRASSRDELVDLQRRSGATLVLVTHDQAEAMALGDRLAVLDLGRVAQVGTPQAVYDRPASRFVARFIGQPPMNLLPCLIALEGDALVVRITGNEHLGPFRLPRSRPDLAAVRELAAPRVDVGLRAEHIRVRPASPESEAPAFVRRLEPTGSRTLASVAVGPHLATSWIAPDAPIRVGDRVVIDLDWDHARWFHAETGMAIDD